MYLLFFYITSYLCLNTKIINFQSSFLNHIFDVGRSILYIVIFYPFILHAEIDIKITQNIYSEKHIGIVPFQWTGSKKAPEDISNIIATDLSNSGKFHPISRSLFPETPSTASEINSSLWMKVNIDSIVIGKVQPSADNSYLISYQLVDTSHNPCLILEQNKYKIEKKWLRYAAHIISDEIFEKFTGMKGIFRTKIAYVVHTNNSKYPYELCISDYDGYNPISIYRASKPLMSPTWSPDGRKLAYVTFESGQSMLVIQHLDCGIIRKISRFPQHNGAPAWSRDGKKLAFSLSKNGSLNLYVMDLIYGNIKQITNNFYNNTEATWFPDNRTLAYTSDKGGLPQIYKIDIYEGDSQLLSLKEHQNQDANVSMDGKFLLMVSINSGKQNIVKLDLLTGNIKILTDTFLDETPSIAPNCSMMIYSCISNEGIGYNLKLVSIEGKECVSVKNWQGRFPVWSPYL